MLIHKIWNEAEDPQAMVLNEMEIWVQVHDIPKDFMS